MKLWNSFKCNVLSNDDTEDEIRRAFQEYDVNGDGYITKDEMIKVMVGLLDININLRKYEQP
jgi:Ca2+-binding EF-hand superfamily protein